MVDLVRLDKYLSSNASPPNAMMLSDLDGFLTGVLCSRELFLPSVWLAKVWGDDAVSDNKEHIWAIQEILARYNEIAAALNSTLSHIGPIFWQAPEGHTIAMDWCEGFAEAMKLDPQGWDEFSASPLGSELFYPIKAHLFDEHDVSLAGVAEQELDATLNECAKHIPIVVPQIFTYWQRGTTH